MTSLFLCWRSTAEKIVYIFLQDLFKRKHYLFRKTDEISRTLRLMHDGISVDKILPKQVGYFGKTINRDFGHNARSATSRFSLAGSSLQKCSGGWGGTTFCNLVPLQYLVTTVEHYLCNVYDGVQAWTWDKVNYSNSEYWLDVLFRRHIPGHIIIVLLINIVLKWLHKMQKKHLTDLRFNHTHMGFIE
jgi:hypothetical protein